MKIAQIPGCSIPFSPDLPHTPYSISTISYYITEELVKRGHKVTVFGVNDSITSAKIADGWYSSNDPIFKKYDGKSKEMNVVYDEYCKNIIKQADQFDIIHNHTNGFFKFIKQTKTPVVTTFHADKLHNYEKQYYDDAMLVGISKNQIKTNKELNFVGLAYNAIDMQRYIFDGQPKNYLGWLGRITKIKGTLEAVEVAAETDERLLLAGNIENPKDEYVLKVLKLVEKHKDKIKYIGTVNYVEKMTFLKDAKALLVPIQWQEPFGLVMVEAMACGVPVIANDIGPVREIVKNKKTGFVVKNKKEMIKAIKNIKKIKRANCRKHVEKKFDIKNMVDSYEKIYEKILKDKWKKEFK